MARTTRETKRPTGLFLMALAGTLLLQGCTQVRKELEAFPMLFNPPINLTEYNYGATDALVGQAGSAVHLETPIVTGTLHPTNLDPGTKPPPFGQIVAQQVGTRLVQLGYNVQALDSPTDDFPGSERTTIDAAKKTDANALITGSYTIGSYDILVNLRLIGLRSGRVLAATDYRLPLAADTRKFLNMENFWAKPGKPLNEGGKVPELSKTKPGNEDSSDLAVPILPVQIVP